MPRGNQEEEEVPPQDLLISSTGPIKDLVSHTFGLYELCDYENKGRPVYATGSWLLSDTVDDSGCWLQNRNNWMDFVPTNGWEYANKGFHNDTVLTAREQGLSSSLIRKVLDRLDTFTDQWPGGTIQSQDLAEAGFLYLGYDDKVCSKKENNTTT